MEHNFSPSQQLAYDSAQNGDNIFISGSAGKGKSYLTRALTTPSTVVVAPTGIAALNVNGSTCHRTFSLPLGIPTGTDWDKIPQKMIDLFSGDAVKRIILSEVGMLRTDMLELIDHRLKKVRFTSKPFGGIQIIAEGDFFQLESIVSNQERQHFYKRWDSHFCFTSEVWDFKTCLLKEAMRHPFPDQVEVLERIRYGDKSALPDLMAYTKPYEMLETTLHLCCYNQDAENVNKYWYSKIDSPEEVYYARIEGQMTERDTVASEIVKLKVGAKVLVCANDAAGTYVNGDRGVVEELTRDWVLVKKLDGTVAKVEPFTWTKNKYVNQGGNLATESEGKFTQIPLLLGWAISVHKSQSLTLDDVAFHIGKGCFGHGQFYTAVSRIKDLRNLSFLRPQNVTEDDIIVRKEVKKFYLSGGSI